MTANKNLKKLIRSRMRKTGEAYTVARRYFLYPKEEAMKTQDKRHNQARSDLSVDRLALTLKTARVLKTNDIVSIADLLEKTDLQLAEIGLTQEGRIEVRETLASRGL